MSDILSVGTVADQNSDASAATGSSRYGSDLNTGVLGRKYIFGDKVSALSIAQDPFFRFVSKVAKSPTDDPSLSSQNEDTRFIKDMYM